MKNYFFVLFIFLFTFCSKDEPQKEEPEPITNSCIKIDSLVVTQAQDELTFRIVTNNSYLAYEISYQQSNGNNQPDAGSIIQSTSKNFKKAIDDLDIFSEAGLYVFYVRGVCDQEKKSDWNGPVFVQLNEFCKKPIDVTVEASSFGTDLRWDYFSNANAYQIQYGTTGFALGNGTLINTNVNYYYDIPVAANTTYDFYVRTLCSNSLGWSTWSGPVTHYSPTNQNLCLMPTNLYFEYEGAGYYTAKWGYNGEYNFEYAITSNASSPITSISSIGIASWPSFYVATSKYFRVRAVCKNGNRTSWVGAYVP